MVFEPQINDSNILETIFLWQLPCSLNGELEYFKIDGYGSWDGRHPEEHRNHSILVRVPVDPNFQKNDVFSLNLGELRAQYTYLFNISAVNRGANKEGLPYQ